MALTFLYDWELCQLGDFLFDLKLEKVNIKNENELLILGLHLFGLRIGANKKQLIIWCNKLL